MAQCILHVGTHKTGTTALQLAFASDTGWAERAGLYYPRSCRVYGGHHHLPFELLEWSKYDPAGGSLASLVDEIADRPDRTSIVSSEVLHFLAARPDEMRALVAGLARRGVTARIVLYLRERASYAESLYGQLLGHGLSLPFGAFAHAIALDGSFRFDPYRRYDLAYARVAAGFAEAFGVERTIVRAYMPDGEPDAIVRDFLDAIGVSPDAAEDAVVHRSNPTDPFRAVVERWLGNRPARASGSPDIEAAARALFGDAAGAVLDGPFRVFDADEAAAFDACFAEDDAELARVYGVRLAPVGLRGPSALPLFAALVKP
jgi:hypothetical protein